MAGYDPITKTKVCTKCKERLPLAAFYGDPRNVDGRQTRCIRCFLAAGEQRRRAAGAKPQKRHGFATQKEYLAWWYAQNRETQRAKGRAYYLKNREAIRAAEDAKLRASPELRAAAVKRAAEWAAANPERARVARSTSKARRRAAGERKGKLSPNLVPLLLAEQNHRCPYCLVDLRESGYHLDHHLPLARGGMHEDMNIQLTCPSCNLQKADADPIIFVSQILEPLLCRSTKN